MSVIFKFISKNGQIEWGNPSELKRYLIENEGTEQFCEIDGSVKLTGKEKLYRYYHAVVLGVMIKELSDRGWDGVDKMYADWWLKNQCARNIKYNLIEDKSQIFLEEKHLMDKDRLCKYVNDCIIYIETEFGVSVPDSAEYRYKLTNFKSVKNGK